MLLQLLKLLLLLLGLASLLLLFWYTAAAFQILTQTSIQKRCCELLQCLMLLQLLLQLLLHTRQEKKH